MARKNNSTRPSSVNSPEDDELLSESSLPLGFPEIKKRRHNPYFAARSTSLNSNFRHIWQEKLYNQIYCSLDVFQHKYVKWSDIANPEVCAFDVSIKYQNLDLKDLATENSSWVWNKQIVKQFYSTLFINPDRTKMDFMIGSKHYSATKEDFEKALSIKPKADSIVLHKSEALDIAAIDSLYIVPGSNSGKVDGLKAEVDLIQKICRHTIFPRSGRGRLSTMLLRLAHAIYHEERFDIVHFLLSEMCEVIETPDHALPYAPHIFCLLRYRNLIPKDTELDCSLKMYSPQLPKPDDQVNATLTEYEVREVEHPMIEQAVPYPDQPQQTVTLDSLAASITQLSKGMENFQKEVATNFQTMMDDISKLSSEVVEIKAYMKDPRHVLNCYKRRRV